MAIGVLVERVAIGPLNVKRLHILPLIDRNALVCSVLVPLLPDRVAFAMDSGTRLHQPREIGMVCRDGCGKEEWNQGKGTHGDDCLGWVTGSSGLGGVIWISRFVDLQFVTWCLFIRLSACPGDDRFFYYIKHWQGWNNKRGSKECPGVD